MKNLKVTPLGEHSNSWVVPSCFVNYVLSDAFPWLRSSLSEILPPLLSSLSHTDTGWSFSYNTEWFSSNLSFLFMPSKLYLAQQKYFMVDICCFPSSSQWWWRQDKGWGKFHSPENIFVWKQRIIPPQMSVVLRLRNPGIHKCLLSFRGLFPFIWMMQFWWSCGTYSLTNGKPFARLSLIFGAPIPWPHTKNGHLYQSGPILAWGCILQMHSCMPAWGLGRKFTRQCL